jgi:hypothetical protein
MNRRAALFVPFALLGGPSLLTGAASAQPAQAPAPPHMTTPTADYCAHLNREVARARGAGAVQGGPSTALADEGARMCDRGQYRGGVVRLRRALALMRNGR